MKSILVLGASGQIGTDLVRVLVSRFSAGAVIAADIRPDDMTSLRLDVLDKHSLRIAVQENNVKQIYLLAAMLSATGEKYPAKAWHLNMEGLLNVLDVAVECKVEKVFFPSSIAVYGPQLGMPTTVYGISKYAGELWCKWYHEKYGLDVRSIRFPGLISHTAEAGGGTTDYAVDIFREAIAHEKYTCYLKPETKLPMMYMSDAVIATANLMAAPKEKLGIRMGYDISGFSVTPADIAASIQERLPMFRMEYAIDPVRQAIADSWPASVDDSLARNDWGWKPHYDLQAMTSEMISSLAMSMVLE